MPTSIGMPREAFATSAVKASKSSDSARQGRRIHATNPTRVDPILQVDDALLARIPSRITRGNALHRRLRFPVTIGARARCVGRPRGPQRSAASTHSMPGFCRSSICIARTSAPENAMPERNCRVAVVVAGRGSQRECRTQEDRQPFQVATSIVARASPVSPASSIQSMRSSPESTAVTKNRR